MNAWRLELQARRPSLRLNVWHSEPIERHAATLDQMGL